MPADWQAWLLAGEDPAAAAYADGDLEAFYRLHAGRPPAWHEVSRRLDAHKRWSAARIAWLRARELPWLEDWIDAANYERRVLLELGDTAGP